MLLIKKYQKKFCGTFYHFITFLYFTICEWLPEFKTVRFDSFWTVGVTKSDKFCPLTDLSYVIT